MAWRFLALINGYPIKLLPFFAHLIESQCWKRNWALLPIAAHSGLPSTNSLLALLSPMFPLSVSPNAKLHLTVSIFSGFPPIDTQNEAIDKWPSYIWKAVVCTTAALKLFTLQVEMFHFFCLRQCLVQFLFIYSNCSTYTHPLFPFLSFLFTPAATTASGNWNGSFSWVIYSLIHPFGCLSAHIEWREH